MKKNILVKLLCLLLVCVLVLPMIVACGGNSLVVTFDANGGIIEVDGEEYDEWEKYVAENDRIGTLPTPTRPGYVFDGWYEEEDEDFEDKIRKTTKVEFDMILVAKWKQVNWGEPGSVGSVEFDFAGGHILETDENGEEVEVDELIRDVDYNDRVSSLPEPEKEGYTFEGWFYEDSKGNTVQLRATTVMTQQFIVAIARWKEIPKCSDNTYNHAWGFWDDTYQLPTCTQDGISVSYCEKCGSKQTRSETPATGHDWGAGWVDNFSLEVLGAERTCRNCQFVEKDQFKNIMGKEAMGGELVKVDGTAFGGDSKYGCVTNGAWDDAWTTTLQGNNSALILTFEVQKTVYADFLVTATDGSGVGFTIEYLPEGSTEWQLLTRSGSVGVAKFDIGERIDGIRISENSSHQGLMAWQEVGLLVRSENYVAE
ncbi:MAG: InlB B-repeat-containing protein [Clostridia bacterium]|nr:InlB B-repeat-containing protein [Clostridia bacterium]